MGSNDRYTTARLIQNLYLDNFQGVDWTIYNSTEEQHHLLKKNIGYAVFGSPVVNNVLGYSNAQTKTIIDIYTAICNNHCLANNELYIRIIYIFLSFNSATMQDGSLPLFVVKKCDAKSNPCVKFIDTSARVYKTWDKYLKNNTLPECVMVCPRRGKYSGTLFKNEKGEEDVEVDLEYYESPRCDADHQIVKVTDGIGAGVSAVSALTLAISMIPAVTLAPALITAAVVGGIGTGLYSAGRSIYTLADRDEHQQSISLSNAEARNCWLNATVGLVTVGTSGASAALTGAARSGAVVGTGARVAFNSLSIANLFGSTANCSVSIFNFLEKLNDKNEKITVNDVFQLSSSILFFQLSIVNFRLANTIIQETQASVLSQYEAKLRTDLHRKVFNKAKKEFARTQGETAGNAEIIRRINKIENPEQFFAGMVDKVDLNKMGTKQTLNVKDEIEINNTCVVDSVEFNDIIVLNKHVTLTTPKSGPSAGLTADQYNSRVSNLSAYCATGAAALTCAGLLMRIVQNADAITLFLKNFCQNSVDKLVGITIQFCNEVEDECTRLENIHPLVNPTVLAVQYVTEYIKRLAELTHIELTKMINAVFVKLPRYIKDMVQSFKQWCKAQIIKYNSVPNIYIDLTKKKRKYCYNCDNCKGQYFFYE